MTTNTIALRNLAVRAAGAVLLSAAAVVLLIQVDVDVGGLSRSCGSAWDVVSGRDGWDQWWTADLADPAQARGSVPVRTARCPAAVNRRVLWSGVLAAGAAIVVVGGAALPRRRVNHRRASAVSSVRRLRVLGRSLTLLGVVLSISGAAGLALLTADPRSTLFLYVSRTAVVLTGLLLLFPAVLLIAVGRVTALLAEHLIAGNGDRERS